MITKSKAIWTLGAGFLSVVMFASSPAVARERNSQKEAAKAAERVIEARRDAVVAAEKARTRAAEASAKARQKAVVSAAKAREKAADAVTKAAESRQRAAEAQAKARQRVAADASSHRLLVAAPAQRPVSFSREEGKTHVSVGIGLGLGLGHGTHQCWVPGRFETRFEEVCLEPAHYEWRLERVEVEPGHYEMRYVSAVQEILYDSLGNAHKIVVRPGRTERVWVPARYETRNVRVWVPARYETREVRAWVPGHWVWVPAGPPARTGLSLQALFKF